MVKATEKANKKICAHIVLSIVLHCLTSRLFEIVDFKSPGWNLSRRSMFICKKMCVNSLLLWFYISCTLHEWINMFWYVMRVLNWLLWFYWDRLINIISCVKKCPPFNRPISRINGYYSIFHFQFIKLNRCSIAL